MSKPEVVLCRAVHTTVGTYRGSLKEIPVPDLGSAAIREVLKRSNPAPENAQALALASSALEIRSCMIDCAIAGIIKRGIVTRCIGGGQGIALAVEML